MRDVTKGPGDLSHPNDPQNEPDDNGQPTHAERLALMPGVIAEVVFSDEDAAAIAAALRDGDLAEIGRVFVVARDRYVGELIQHRKLIMHGTMDDDEAAERLCEVYS